MRDEVSFKRCSICRSTHPDIEDALALRNASAAEEIEQTVGEIPGNPLSDAALVEKFVTCAARAVQPLADTDARAIAAQVLTLDERSAATSVLRHT